MMTISINIVFFCHLASIIAITWSLMAIFIRVENDELIKVLQANFIIWLETVFIDTLNAA